MIKTLIFSSLFKFCFAGEVPLLVGSQKDTHNCVTDGGYSWCESSQRCVRPWEEPCPSFTDATRNLIDVEFCSHSPIQMCRMACEIPQCQEVNVPLEMEIAVIIHVTIIQFLVVFAPLCHLAQNHLPIVAILNPFQIIVDV